MNHGERVIYRAVYDSPIGLLTLTALDDALGALSFPRERYPKDAELLKAGKEVCIPQKDRLPAVLRDTFRWLDIYFSGKYRILCRLLRRREASFRRMVWNQLLKIPYGCTVTYGELAKAVAYEKGISRMSAQAVGGAVGHNPIGIIIPCHRVVGAGGNLTGFGGGIKAKEALLEREGMDMERFYVPTRGTAL